MILECIAEAECAGARLESACELLGVATRTIQRWRSRPDGDDRRCGPRRRAPNALSEVEQARILAIMTSPMNAGVSPKQLVPRLADEGIYLASESTMYRLRRRLGLRSCRRSTQRTSVSRASTLHRALAPNRVWSWDITYLPTTIRGRYLYLYLVMDIWSRRIVGWEIYEQESADCASSLIRRICEETGVDAKGLVLHSDNGKPMRGSTMISTLQWLGIVPSFSRPHVSDDNPYSEALFRTLKHTPVYPRLPFAGLDTANAWMARFVSWYNREHRHSAIRYVTPDERHFGQQDEILASRHLVYQRARRRRPERWSGSTRNWTPIGAVLLNPEPAALHAA